MKLFTKRIFAILVIATMLLTMVACGQKVVEKPAQDTVKETTSDDTKTTEEKTTLTIWTPVGSNALWFESVVEHFAETDPNLEIIVENHGYGDYHAILKTALGSGEGPDIAWNNSASFIDYVSAGYLLQLDNYYEQYGWADAIGEDMAAMTMVDGGQPALLVDAPFMPLFYYDKGIFSELSLEVPSTMEEFYALSATLEDNGYLPVVAGNKDRYLGTHLYYSFLQNLLPDEEKAAILADWKSFDFESEVGIEAMRQLAEFGDKVWADGCNALSISDTQGLLLAKKAAVVQKESYWLGKGRIAAEYENPAEEIGVFFMPSINVGEDLIVTVEPNAIYTIMKDCENPDAAAKVLDYLVSEAGQTTSAFAGMGVIRNGLEIDPELAGPLMASALDSKSQLESEVHVLTFASTEFKATLETIVQELTSGDKTPEAAAKALNDAKE